MPIMSHHETVTEAVPGQPPSAALALTKDMLAAFAAAGATDENLADARLLLARGTIFETAASLANDADRDLFACLDGTARMVANGQSLKPILDGIKAEQAIRHYPWCTDACVVNRYDDGTVSVEHIGHKQTLSVPPGMEVRDGDLMSAYVGHDKELENGPTVYLSSGGNGVPLNAHQLSKFLNDLDAFRDELRVQLAQLDEELQA